MSNIDLVKRLNAAGQSKDFDTVKSLLHPNYTLKDPKMQFSNPEEFIEFMKDCPFDGSLQNVQMLEDGNKVVQTLDCVMTAPIPFRFRMCDILTIEDGKVRSEETFYDTAQFPPEVKALEDKLTREKQSKKAA